MWLYSSFLSIFLLSHSCHIKVMTKLSVAVAGKRPDLWLRTAQVLLKMVGKEEKDEENEKNTEYETVAIQSLIQLVSSYDSHNNKCQIYQLSLIFCCFFSDRFKHNSVSRRSHFYSRLSSGRLA